MEVSDVAVVRAIVKTSSLAKLLTGSERRDDKAVRLHEVTGYGIFPHTSKRLVHTYPNIFENEDFFLDLNKKYDSRGSVMDRFSPVQTKVQIR